SVPGVFAIGDVRANSTKRVGAAIGEGAAVVAQIHQMLAAANNGRTEPGKARDAAGPPTMGPKANIPGRFEPPQCRPALTGRRTGMRTRFILAALAFAVVSPAAQAQVTVDMSAIRCDQYMAMGPAMSRDFSAWMSGWFSYQTR